MVLLVHGCVHSGYNWFPQSEECPECRGLPEEMSHTLQALRRSYAGAAERIRRRRALGRPLLVALLHRCIYILHSQAQHSSPLHATQPRHAPLCI